MFDESQEWQLKKESELLTIRLKHGSEINPSLPVIAHHHRFPDCDDPELILKCMNQYRKEWDQQLEVYDELEEYRN